MRWTVAFALLLLAVPARAETKRVVRYRLEATADCATSTDFAASFAKRSRSSELTSGDEASPVVVRFAETTSVVVADLTIRLDDGSTVKRRLEAKSCFEAREAMAFVLALALDPEHLDDAPIPEPPSPREQEAPSVVSKPSRPEKEVSSARLAFGLGLLGTTELGLTPAPAFGAGIGFEVRRFREGGPTGPSLRFEVRHAVALDRATAAGVAHFETTTLALGLCPFELPLSALRVRPCATGVLGVLAAEGRNTFEGARHVAEFGALGAHLLGDFPLGDAVRLGLGGGGIVPLRRDSYQFDSTVFFVTEPLVFDGNVGLFFFFG